MSNDDKAQTLSSSYGRILLPYLLKAPPFQHIFASSQVAFSPLAPHNGKNNIPLDFSHLRTTSRGRLMPIGVVVVKS